MTLKQISLRLFALISCLLLARSADASILTAFGVDSSLPGGGTMSVAPNSLDFNNGVLNLTATNSSATKTYLGVGLTIEFIFPLALNSPHAQNGNGFNYQGLGKWSNTGDTQELQFLSVDPPYASILQPLLPAIINVPLSDNVGGFSAGPLATTDAVPLIELGDFGPNVSKPFTLRVNEPKGAVFYFLADGFFVAVPEPSTFVLVAIGGVALLFARRRSRRAAASSR